MSTKKEQLERAQQHLQRGQLTDALNLFKALQLKDPDNLAIIHSICIVYAQTGKLKNAVRLIHSAIKRQPLEPSLYNSLGNIKQRLNQPSEAIKAYEHALQLNPYYPGALNNLGNVLLKQNQAVAAETCYLKALEVDPLYPDAHFNLARLHAEREKINDAIKHLHQVITVIPQHAAAQGLLGHLYLRTQQNEKAITHLKARLTVQPNHAVSLQELGTATLNLNQPRLAIQYFKDALALDSTLPEIESQLATAFLVFGNREDALSHYLRQLDHEVTLDALYNIGVIYADLQRHQDAISYFSRALTQEPNHLATHLNLAAVYLKTNEHKKAIMHYQTAHVLSPNNPEIQHILNALEQKQNPAVAPVEYSKNLFDHYATGYDKHLLETLRYTVPQQIHHLIMTELNPKDHSLKILDLGCGTGLVGEQFEPQAKELIGVDISAAMIHQAQQKNIYTTLQHQSVTEALKQFKQLDLIIAADVFPYLGDLNAVFISAKNALKSDGYFVFSVEKTDLSDYHLQKTIRYAHKKEYISSLSSAYCFEIINQSNSVLRKQQQKPIEGLLFLLKSK